ncbi:hypothetical protein HAX54_017719 [Datura stramonium]|uniref:Uncharacterized protein n=1 Tax=Datura stramonium TaxID=4076 RepID=A0ABS8S0U3_DATST|nr:hypothetical protein [Datura stramonium]
METLHETRCPCIKDVLEVKKSPPREESHEVINAWELMEGLDEEVVVKNSKISPKSRAFLRGFGDIDARSPLKFLNQMSSPRKYKKFGGKENKGRANGANGVDFSPKTEEEFKPVVRSTASWKAFEKSCLKKKYRSRKWCLQHHFRARNSQEAETMLELFEKNALQLEEGKLEFYLMGSRRPPRVAALGSVS